MVSKPFSGVLNHWACSTETMHAPRLEVGLDLQVSYCQKQLNGIWVVILLVICATAIPVNIYIAWHPERGSILSLYSIMVMGTGSFVSMGSNLSSTTYYLGILGYVITSLGFSAFIGMIGMTVVPFLNSGSED